MEEVSGDDIADVVLKQFDKLSNKRKPQDRGQGRREWVPLSGIVAQVPVSPGNGNLVCIALATGMKCLPQSKIEQAQGIVLHDWHAEILAIRSFNRFLLEECYALVFSGKEKSEYVRLRNPEEITQEHFQPFALKDGINLHMYCSEAPCGDASMELTMAAQEDSSPWSLPATEDTSAKASSPLMDNPYAPTVLPTVLHGRGYFSELGIVRRKPSRPDAPPTLSKSCSDKLALKQSTSLLSSITSLLIHPGNSYLASLILPSSQFSQVACDRAFGPNGRLSPIHHISSKWPGGYRFAPFTIKTTEREFSYSRRSAESTGPLVPSNIAVSWTGNGKEETIINGTLQGRKQFDVRGASRMCKRRMWKITLEAAAVSCSHGIPMLKDLSHATLYEDVKEMSCLTNRRLVKEEVRKSSLKGWIKNRGEEFEIDGVET